MGFSIQYSKLLERNFAWWAKLCYEGRFTMADEKRQLRPYQGILVFLLYIVMMFVLAAPIQYRLGMYGVLITEVMILALGILPAIIFKADLREVFPIKKPKLRQIGGVGILWIGSLLIVTLVSLVLGYLFPQSFSEVNQGLTDVFKSVPGIITILIIAVSPAICEEVLVRGFILSSLNSIKNKWLLILIMGVIFGLFHLNGIRFLPTGILGIFLAYIMIETKNLLLPALFHFINNGFSSIISIITPTSSDRAVAQTVVTPLSIGVYTILCSVAPLLILLGAMLLKEKVQVPEEAMATGDSKRGRWIRLSVALGIFGVMLVTGIVTTLFSVLGMVNQGHGIEVEEQVNQDTEDLIYNLPVEKSGYHHLKIASNYEYGIVIMKIQNEAGKVVCEEILGREMTLEKQIFLEQGMHDVILEIATTQSELESYGFQLDDKLAEDLNLKGDLSRMTTLKFALTLKRL